MRALIVAVVLIAAALAGCGHSDQQRQTQEYEAFLKQSLGTVALDPPPQARGNHSDVGL